MTFKEVLNKAMWSDVLEFLQKSYKDISEDGYREVYDKLYGLDPTSTDFIIHIEHYWDGEYEYDHVSGRKSNDEESHAIGFSPWSEWLGMEVHEEVLKNYSPVEIVGHCLWEMTWYGFNEERISNILNKLELDEENESEEYRNGNYNINDEDLNLVPNTNFIKKEESNE